MKPKAVIILTTCPNQQEADTIIQALFEERLAACIQASTVTSTYRWKGTIESASEIRLLIKTNDTLFDAISSCINKVTDYENPEILCIPVTKGSFDYLEWITEETS